MTQSENRVEKMTNAKCDAKNMPCSRLIVHSLLPDEEDIWATTRKPQKEVEKTGIRKYQN